MSDKRSVGLGPASGALVVYTAKKRKPDESVYCNVGRHWFNPQYGYFLYITQQVCCGECKQAMTDQDETDEEDDEYDPED